MSDRTRGRLCPIVVCQSCDMSSSQLQNDRPLFEKIGQVFFVYVVTCKQRFSMSSDGGLTPSTPSRIPLEIEIKVRGIQPCWWITGPSSAYQLSRSPLSILHSKSLFTCHSVNKRILPYFIEKRSIVLQLAVKSQTTSIFYFPGFSWTVANPTNHL